MRISTRRIATLLLSDPQPEAGQATQRAHSAHMSAAGKDVVVVPLDVVQDRPVQLGGSSDGEASIVVQQPDAGPRLSVETAGAPDLKPHEGTPAIINPPSGQIGLRQPVGHAFLEWQIDPSQRPIFTDIAEDVG